MESENRSGSGPGVGSYHDHGKRFGQFYFQRPCVTCSAVERVLTLATVECSTEILLEKTNMGQSVSVSNTVRVCRVDENAAKADDAALTEALESYHREKLTNNQKISERLKREHGITMRFVSPSHTLRPRSVLSIWIDPVHHPSSVVGKNSTYKVVVVQPSQCRLIRHASLLSMRWMLTVHVGRV